MKTSSFHEARDRPGRICIARWAPRGYPKGYRRFGTLAPGDWFKSVSAAEFLRRYEEEVLAPLDPKAIWDQLHALAGEQEPILLCWERTPLVAPCDEGTWCHRRIVADWLADELGVEIFELGQPDVPRHRGASGESPPPKQTTLF